jgi:elongation factor Ts
MAEITAGMVKELRERTGLGMMECKKALQEAEGDLKKAEDLLRIKSGAKATKVAGRVAAEGAIGVYVSADGKRGALVEVNCETDFVAKDTSFADFVGLIAETAAQQGVADVEKLVEQKVGGETIESLRQALVMKLGENMSVRRVALHQAQGSLSYYLHGSRIGVMVDVTGGDEALGKDLSMHIAASKPVAVSKDQVPAETIEREREIAKARAL